MLERKQFDRFVALLCLSSLLSSIALSWATVAVAENNNQNTREGLPLRRVGGGTRSGCTFASNQFTALIPERIIAKTTKTNPKFYFYIPENTAGKQLEFVLRDRLDRQVYETTFISNGKSGIIGIELPATKSNLLAAEENYHWYFSLLCTPDNRSQDIVLEGSIERIELDASLAQKLARSTPMERVNLYQTANIWYDAISTLAELKLSSSETLINSEWQALLESVGLANLAQKPLI
jgi:Domain of Unknown Function (DUF928)